MPRFVGPQPGYKSNGNKGVMRAYKKLKRQEAEQRIRDKKKLDSIDTRETSMVDSGGTNED